MYYINIQAIFKLCAIIFPYNGVDGLNYAINGSYDVILNLLKLRVTTIIMLI